MKLNPAVAGYIVAGVAVGVLVWWITKKLDLGLGAVGDAVDAVAEKTGNVISAKAEASAAEAYAPQILYAQARGDYARNLGLRVGINTLPDWPSLDRWLDGEGPYGYTYGSTRYPMIEETSWSSAFWNNF